MHSDGVIVIGAGGHAKTVMSALQAAGDCIEAIVDDDPELWGQRRFGIPIRGPTADLETVRGGRAILAIGDARIRRKLAARLDLRWARVVHPHSWVHDTVRLKPGAVVCAGVVIQPDSTIGAHAIINTAASVDHDCVIGDFVHLAPGVHLAGEVQVGDGALLGIGSVVAPGITIGENTTVGAGSVVVRDVPAGVVAAGSPTQIKRSKRTAEILG